MLNYPNLKPNYRAFIGLGVSFIAAGIASSVTGLIALGFIFMLLGVVKKRRTTGEIYRLYAPVPINP